MNAEDDPEARIRELERPLSKLAEAAELTASSVAVEQQASPPRGSGQRIAIVVGAMAAVFVFAATAAAVYFITGLPTSPTSEPSRAAPTPPRSTPTPSSIAPVPGGTISITGAGENKTVVCVGSYVTVSGVNNTVALTGQCAGLGVSGVDNVITVEATPKITVSGIRNRVTYRSGDPEVGTSGLDNVVERG